MPFTLTDSTSNTQRIAIDNSSNTEFGTATPSANLTIQGRALLNGSTLAASIVSPAALSRTQGSVSVVAQSTSTVTVSAQAGFGVVNNGGLIVSFSSNKTQVVIANPSATSMTLTYAVI